jgi:hypothetical protein
MAQTRKNRGKKIPMYAVTFHALHEWHKKMFEELGWMVLLKAKGFDYKITVYKKGIDHLLKAIDHLMKEYEDHNRKHDLNVLRMNVMVLREFAMKHL